MAFVTLASSKLCVDRAWGYTVYPDLPFCIFLCKIPGQPFCCCFKCTIYRHTRERKTSKPGRDIDNLTTIIHQRNQLLRKKKHAFEVYIHKLIEDLFGSVFNE